MNQVFDSYARYYDLLYQDKDYVAETEYVVSHIRENAPQAKKILELGCGTGAHAEHLARMGYTVHGVDMSEEMLARAESRKASLPFDVAARLTFSVDDARTVNTGQIYDAVISLFHVMSYQSTNDDLLAVFETAARHLSGGGLFLYDFWYGPAVLTQRPDTRVKRLENSEIKVTRIAEPVLNVNENIVEVNYHVFIEDKSIGGVKQLRETHRMRYFFLPELALYRRQFWTELVSEVWLDGGALSEQTWSGVQLLLRAKSE